jgi:hypothetical protein
MSAAMTGNFPATTQRGLLYGLVNEGSHLLAKPLLKDVATAPTTSIVDTVVIARLAARSGSREHVKSPGRKYISLHPAS